MKRFCCLLLSLVLLTALLIPFAAEDRDRSEKTAQVEAVLRFIGAINDKNDAACVSCYTSDQREQMDAAARTNPIQEASVEVLAIKQLSEQTGLRAAAVSPEERERYTDLGFVLSKEYVTASEDAAQVTSGEYDRVYVLSFENGGWKLVRRSAADMEIVRQAGEDFRMEAQDNTAQSGGNESG